MTWRHRGGHATDIAFFYGHRRFGHDSQLVGSPLVLYNYRVPDTPIVHQAG